MTLNEFIERDLLVSDWAIIYDQDCNEYRDENGSLCFLDVDNNTLVDIIRNQIHDNKGTYLIEDLESWL